MAIDQHADYSISVHQTKYIEKMLDKFVPSHSVNSVKHSKPCSPEAFGRLSIAKDDNERERVSKLPYLQIIGSLLYLSTMTRPDISFYVTMLCKYMHDPSLECYDAAVSLLLAACAWQWITLQPSTFARIQALRHATNTLAMLCITSGMNMTTDASAWYL